MVESYTRGEDNCMIGRNNGPSQSRIVPLGDHCGISSAAPHFQPSVLQLLAECGEYHGSCDGGSGSNAAAAWLVALLRQDSAI